MLSFMSASPQVNKLVALLYPACNYTTDSESGEDTFFAFLLSSDFTHRSPEGYGGFDHP